MEQILSFVNDYKLKMLIIQKNQNEPLFTTLLDKETIKDDSFAVLKRANFQFEFKNNNFQDTTQIMNVSYQNTQNPIVINHLYIQNCILPLFNVYKGQMQEKSLLSEKDSYSILLKKLNELNISLIQCQQSIEIREISLDLLPQVKTVCQQYQGKKIELDELELLNNNEFIQNLSSQVLKWVKDIKSVINTNYDLANNGTTLQEINYWINYEKSLKLIEQQISKPEVELTINILKKKHKTHIYVAFENDLEFKQTLNRVSKITQFMKELPLNDLLSSFSINTILSALKNLFKYLNGLIQLPEFYERSHDIIESISRDVKNQVLKVLTEKEILKIPFQEFKQIHISLTQLFDEFSLSYNIFKQKLQKAYVKPKSDTLRKCFFVHTQLKDRIDFLYKIKDQHTTMRQIIETIIKKDKYNYQSSFLKLSDLDQSFDVFLTKDWFNLDLQGEEELQKANKIYQQRIDKIETIIAQNLREKLGKTTNSNEMFRIFEKFNPLFYRPHIESAIKEYQSQLLKTVQKDIQRIKEKYHKQYRNSQNSVICKSRDIPEYSGNLIWQNQIQEKMKTYFERIKNVLGEQWDKHRDGKELKLICEEFIKHLEENSEKLVDNWTNDIKEKKFGLDEEYILKISNTKPLELKVNFDEAFINSFKECRLISHYKPQTSKIYYSNIFKAKATIKYYPTYIIVNEALRTYSQAQQKIKQFDIHTLLAQKQQDIQNILTDGWKIKWNEENKMKQFTQDLSKNVSAYDEFVNQLTEKQQLIDDVITKLNLCQIDNKLITDHLSEIQSIIDDLNLKNFSNIHVWVEKLDDKIKEILTNKLSKQIDFWIQEFQQYQQNFKENKIILETERTKFEIIMKNQSIQVEPCIEDGRFVWINSLNRIISSICKISRLRWNKFEDQKQSILNYADIQKEQKISNQINQAFKTIQNSYYQAKDFIQTWLSYQSLWRLDISIVLNCLGDNIET